MAFFISACALLRVCWLWRSKCGGEVSARPSLSPPEPAELGCSWKHTVAVLCNWPRVWGLPSAVTGGQVKEEKDNQLSQDWRTSYMCTDWPASLSLCNVAHVLIGSSKLRQLGQGLSALLRDYLRTDKSKTHSRSEIRGKRPIVFLGVPQNLNSEEILGNEGRKSKQHIHTRCLSSFLQIPLSTLKCLKECTSS